MNHVNWSALYDALQRIERLTPDDSGLLSFGPTRNGAIFVERGRICWVAARGLGQRLGELLLDSSGELEHALRWHSAECLLELCRDAQPTRWTSHVGRTYGSQFTFRPVDLLFDAVALAFPSESARARQELRALAAPGRRGAAFVYDAHNERLLPAAETGDYGVGSLRALAHLACAVPVGSLDLAASSAFTLAATEEGRAVAVWWRNGLLFAVPCDDRATLAAVTARALAAA